MSQINRITSNIPGLKPIPEIAKAEKSGDRVSFGSFMREVNQAQKEAGEKIISVINGKEEDLHSAMVASEKAGLSFRLMLELRNKLLETYHEIMRMRF
ncbi:MAG: flagellar hook-basal body complex protein FliE [Candidatus Marinimicrobia bacterium]|nr:flagellar hook-basal body complex protein FliE [Candidatus Neomarinimicrobiota bacterium]